MDNHKEYYVQLTNPPGKLMFPNEEEKIAFLRLSLAGGNMDHLLHNESYYAKQVSNYISQEEDL